MALTNWHWNSKVNGSQSCTATGTAIDEKKWLWCGFECEHGILKAEL